MWHQSAVKGEEMEIHVFARFYVLEGKEDEATLALREVLGPSRKESGCVSIHAFRSIRDGRLFYIHSNWKDEEAFEVHAEQPHTVQFLTRMETLIDHAFDVTRAEQIG
jgi:quinol monooxygenase YgiN